MYSLKTMPVEVNHEGYPFSTEFNDIFFADEDGLAESRYVFLEQNQLPTRWAQSDEVFTIGELGFGTGLNFLASLDLWRKSVADRKASQLNYISFERYPLRRDTILSVMKRWPELTNLTEEFLKHYRDGLSEGIHEFPYAADKTTLFLVIGDAADMITRISSLPKVDAWYLDGFAPRKNPEMWSDTIFQKMAIRSRPLATIATYTSAGWVKRNLQSAGFRIEKFKGFGRKRDMLKGSLVAEF